MRMQITDHQKKLLSSLRCERLSSCQENLRLVESFFNERNESLVHTLKSAAYEDDESSKTAFYVIKRGEDILFYFSLKCGLLYDSSDLGDRLSVIRDLYNLLIELGRDSSDVSEEERLAVASVLECVRSRKGLVKGELAKISKVKKNKIIADLENESEDNLKRVGRTFAGVELVHFCANDACRDFWDKTGIAQKFGVVVFWKYVVPIILKIRELVGCQYLFLFAADVTPDALLVNYYRSFLGFKDAEEHGTAIPLYDMACKFMYQDLNDISERRKKFFEEFNIYES